MSDPSDSHDPAQDAEVPAMDDLKAKMRAALDRKNSGAKGVPEGTPAHEKAHGSEVHGGGPQMHRRKAGGGGS